MGESEVQLLGESVFGWRLSRRLTGENVAIVMVRVLDGCLLMLDHYFMFADLLFDSCAGTTV